MPTFKLSVSPDALDLGQVVLSAAFAIKRASVVDSFVIVPDLKLNIPVINNESFEVSLLPNTPGSVYEVVMFGARTELMRAFFIMPAGDVFLHELNLLTAYPEMNPVVASFLNLVDTPNSYVGHAGKLVAVKQDETGLEFVSSEPEPSQISCTGATNRVGLIMQINPDANFPNTYIKLVVDGQDHIITVNPITPGNTALPMQNYIQENLADKLVVYPVESSTAIGVGNKTDQNIRLELGAGSDIGYGTGSYNGFSFFANGAGFTDPDNPNPTIIEENDLGVSTVCLAPSNEQGLPQISCVGATDNMNFFYLSNNWETWVDGIYYPSLYNPPYVINTEFEGILQCTSDGFADFSNMDDVPHRIMLVPKVIEGAEVGVYDVRPGNQNQSFMELDDGSIVFCLSAAGQMDCPNGYKRAMGISTSVGVDGNMVEIQNGDTVYIPIALTPDGPSITSPFVVNADLSGIDPDVYWLRIGNNITQHLAEQLNPHGLSATWNNNFKEFGITDSNKVATAAENIEFYILDEGNTYPAEQMPRGLVPASCWMAS